MVVFIWANNDDVDTLAHFNIRSERLTLVRLGGICPREKARTTFTFNIHIWSISIRKTWPTFANTPNRSDDFDVGYLQHVPFLTIYSSNNVHFIPLVVNPPR